LIHAAWSGTQAEGWTPEEAMLQREETRGIVERYRAGLGDFAARKAAYEARLVEWRDLVRTMEGPGGNAGGMLPPPEQPMGPGHAWAPANNFNGVLHPLIPYGIKGVIWYQGEGNGMRGVEYRTLLPVLIGAWRKAWGQGDFPFLIVQLPNFLAEDAAGPSTDANEAAGWPLVREAQEMAAREVAHCGMVVAIDLGHFADLHPGNKEPIGKRLALLARKMVYGEAVIASGPVFKGMKVKGKKATLSFAEVGGGLVMQGESGEKLGGFAVAGADQKFVWAEAEIVGETVVVTSAAVKKVAAVRYLWNASPVASLFNAEGWPAGPFRTDNWDEAAR
jgi:sialate O-acetylesterase